MSLPHAQLMESMSTAFRRIIDARAETRKETSELTGVNLAVIYKVLNHNGRIKKVETFFEPMIRLGAHIEVIAHCPELPRIDSSRKYEIDSEGLRDWMIENTVELLNAKGLTRSMACELYDLDSNTMNFISRGALNRHSFTSCAILMEKLGIHIFFEITHPSVDLSDLCDYEVPPRKELKVHGHDVLEFRHRREVKVDLSQILDASTITKMERGLFRTSMGEVVRAFL